MSTGTLVMKLSAPIQAWGIKGRFNERTTATYPTKSGIVGLLAGSLGRRRDADISDLAMMRIAVRIDQPGTLMRDFQTARTRKYDKSADRYMPDGNPYVSNRYYLENATFVVGVEMDDDLLEDMAAALDHPCFPLFLGRRSCPPSTRVFLDAMPGIGLMDAMQVVPWQGSARAYRMGLMRDNELPDGRIRLMVMRDQLGDVADASLPCEQAHDYPISFSPYYRQFSWRTVVHDQAVVTNPHVTNETLLSEAITFHNPMETVVRTAARASDSQV